MGAGSAIVVGGSVAGLAAGIVLGRLGWRVTVVERSSGTLADRGAGLGMDMRLVRAVLGLGATQRVAAIDDHATSWAQLHGALSDAYAGELLRGAGVTAVREEGGEAHVSLAGGRTLAADVVIGADGYRSGVRAVVAGAGSQSAYAGYLLWR